MKILYPNARIFIATFSPWKHGVRLPINGNLEPMRDFFVPRTRETVIIDQVYPGSDFVLPRIEVYEKGKKLRVHRSSFIVGFLVPLLWLFNRSGTHIVFKLRDFFSVVDWGIRAIHPYDLFVGFEAVNAIAGIMLRRLGRVKLVVYYVSDYSPYRYANKWFNALYVRLDRYAAMHADVLWDVSAAMHEARIGAGLDPKKSAPVIRVPNALYPKQIRHLPLSKMIPYSLVFLGTLGEENGSGLAIESLWQVLKKFPRASLHIIGGPEIEIARLQLLAKNLAISRVVFHGFIPIRSDVALLLQRFTIALAPYRAMPGSVRWYGDATKIRSYMAAGLPTVTTHIPPLGKEVAHVGAAMIVRDDPKEIADAIGTIFRKKKLYMSMRKAAVAFAKENTWENEYKKAFRQMDDL